MSIFDRDRDWLRAQLQNVGLWAGVLGLVILLLSQLFHGSTDHSVGIKNDFVERVSHEIGFALVIAAILVLTVERHSRAEFNRLFERYLSALNTSMTDRLSEVYETMRIAKFPDEINKNELQELRLLGSTIYTKYLDGLHAIPGGFHLDDIDWALESNRMFYEQLTKSACCDAEVRITHTGSIDTWLKFDEARKTLEQQRLFIESNRMRIVRIFVGRAKLEKDSGYFKVMEFMSEFGVRCGYVVHADPSSLIDMTWIPTIHLLSVWKPGVSGGVAGIEITADNIRGDLEVEWSALYRAAQWVK